MPDTIRFVFIESFPTSAWQSNCYLVGANSGPECVIVDPGPDALAVLPGLMERHGRTPVGVLLTHGHVDHITDAEDVCTRWDIPAWIHPGDRHMLTDPASVLGPQHGAMLGSMLGAERTSRGFREPVDLREWRDGTTVELAGLGFRIVDAPGHSPGSVLIHVDGGESPTCLSGDVLFAGSIGRTDLVGGSHPQMLHTLSHHVATLDPATVIHPGHGPATSIGAELARNPFLQGLNSERN